MSTEKDLDRKENLGNDSGSALKSRFKFRFRKETVSSPIHQEDSKKLQNKKGLKRFMNRCSGSGSGSGGNNDPHKSHNTTDILRQDSREALVDIPFPNDPIMETNMTNRTVTITDQHQEEKDSQKKRKVDDNLHYESPPHDSSVKCQTSTSAPFSPDAMEADAFQSLYYNNDNDSDEETHDTKLHYCFQNEINKDDTIHEKVDDEDDEDDISCASTVIMEDRPPRCIRPPPSASKEEQAKFYWEWCYGANSPFPNNHIQNKEKQPLKSCLSAKKTQWTEIAKSATKRMEMRQEVNHMTPDESVTYAHRNPSPSNHLDNSFNNIQWSNSMMNIHTTPKMTTPPNTCLTSSKKKVQFGSASAAEFKSSRPTVELTPLTKDQAMKEFPLDKEIVEEEEEEHQETAMNGAILAAWDDVFDDYANDEFDDGESIMLMDDDDDNDVDDENNIVLNRPLVTHSGSRRKSSKGRRSSSFFQRANGGSLLADQIGNGASSKENDYKMGDEGINPNHSSPSKRDSLLFSSPSELGDSWRLSTSDSEGSRITPITDVTSSSSVLRSLHSSGGAHMGHNMDELCRKDLQPNQLDLKLQQAEAFEMMDCTKSNDDELLCLKSSGRLECSDLHGILKNTIIDVIHEHELTISIFASDIGMNADEQRISLLGMKRDVDEATQSQTSWCPSQDYTADLLGNAIDILEDQNLIDNHDARDFTSKLKLLQNHPREYRDQLYEICARSAMTKWLSCEEEALRLSLAWLAESLNQLYTTDELELTSLLNRMESLSFSGSTCVTKKNIKSQIDTELEIVEQLHACLIAEERMLEKARLEAEYLESRCEFEYNRLYVDDSNCKVLQNILPYTCRFEDDLTIVYPHLDNEFSSTIVKWKPHNIKKGEWIESKEDMSSLEFHSVPSITLEKGEKSNVRIPWPEGSLALELYSKILRSDALKAFILNQFKEEDEMAVLTTSDIYSAIDCLALDILRLESNEDTCVEIIGNSSNAFDILLSLKLDESSLIGLRFSYVLTEGRTLLNLLPSNIIVTSNQSNGSYEHVSTSISTYVLAASRNTFLLSSICSHVRNESLR